MAFFKRNIKFRYQYLKKIAGVSLENRIDSNKSIVMKLGFLCAISLVFFAVFLDCLYRKWHFIPFDLLVWFFAPAFFLILIGIVKIRPSPHENTQHTGGVKIAIVLSAVSLFFLMTISLATMAGLSICLFLSFLYSASSVNAFFLLILAGLMGCIASSIISLICMRRNQFVRSIGYACIPSVIFIVFFLNLYP